MKMNEKEDRLGTFGLTTTELRSVIEILDAIERLESGDGEVHNLIEVLEE